MRKHGMDLCFLGVILTNVMHSYAGKERSSFVVKHLAETIGAEAAIITQDGAGNPWSLHSTESGEHVQEFRDVVQSTDLGPLVQYDGFPPAEHGKIDDWRSQLGKTPFQRSLDPFEKHRTTDASDTAG